MIVLVFTGGTISMRRDPANGAAVPSLSGRDILALAPAIEQIADVEILDWGAHPGPHMTTERMWELRNTLAEQVARPPVQDWQRLERADRPWRSSSLLGARWFRPRVR